MNGNGKIISPSGRLLPIHSSSMPFQNTLVPKIDLFRKGGKGVVEQEDLWWPFGHCPIARLANPPLIGITNFFETMSPNITPGQRWTDLALYYSLQGHN